MGTVLEEVHDFVNLGLIYAVEQSYGSLLRDRLGLLMFLLFLLAVLLNNRDPRGDRVVSLLKCRGLRYRISFAGEGYFVAIG